MPNLGRLSQATQDQILLALYELAKVKVEELVRECYREEVVHELAAVWLKRLREGGWTLPREDWEEFVVEEIRKRRVEDYRARKRSLARDGVHLQVISDAPREWMSQDLKIEEERLRGFLDQVRATLPAKCVRAHAMVRDEQMTYSEVAKQLRVSERRVHEYIKTVHRTFRAALPSVEVAAPKPTRGSRSKATVRDLQSTVHHSQSTVHNLESTARDFESTAHDLPSTVHDSRSTVRDSRSTVAVNLLARVAHESTVGANTLTGTVCSVPAPVQEATSTVRREPVQVCSHAGNARKAAGSESTSCSTASDATGSAHDTPASVVSVTGTA